MQIWAPTSKSAWFHSQARPSGGGTSSLPSVRWSTRLTFVSSAVTWASNAKHAIARAVYGPMPGSSWRPATSRGNAPSSTTRRAARWRLSARRL
jgi:hypothetical protein